MSMHDLSGWVETSCAVADAIRFNENVAPYSSLTDPDGNYGAPIIFTEWAFQRTETLVLRDYREPGAGCRHYVPTAAQEAAMVGAAEEADTSSPVDPRLALVTTAIHLERHPRHPRHCRCHEFAAAAIYAVTMYEAAVR